MQLRGLECPRCPLTPRPQCPRGKNPGADRSEEGGVRNWMPVHYTVVGTGIIEVMAHPVPAGFAE